MNYNMPNNYEIISSGRYYYRILSMNPVKYGNIYGDYDGFAINCEQNNASSSMIYTYPEVQDLLEWNMFSLENQNIRYFKALKVLPRHETNSYLANKILIYAEELFIPHAKLIEKVIKTKDYDILSEL